MSDGWRGDAADLAEVLRFAADPITVQDADGRLVYANEAAAHQVGFGTAAEFLAAPTDEILARYALTDEDGAPLALAHLPGRRALRGEREPAAVIGFRLSGDPGMRWSMVQATPIIDGERVRYVINVFKDITRLKQTEERLRLLADAGAVLAGSDDYQSTLQALAELVVPSLADWCVVDVVERSGLRRVAVAHPDPAKRALAEELQRRYPPDFDRPGGVGDVIRRGEPQLTPTITDEMLVAAARDDEDLEIIRGLGLRSAVVVPLIARGQILGAMTLAGAESGQVYTEADLPFLLDLARRAGLAVDNARLLHEATEAVRLRDEFLAMASHDMRTPLQAILTNVQLAARRLERIGGEPDEERTRLAVNLAQAERTTGRLAHLVGDLLDVATLRSGHPLAIELVDVDLDELARRVVEDHRVTTDKHRLVITGSAGEPVRTDRVRVERVLDNLVENAVKYSPNGGEVIVELEPADGFVVVRVRDEGVGIPADEHELIFEPYHRASNVATMPGIGLGLAGSRSVMRLLGGDLRVERSDGSGTTFVAHVPRSAQL